MFLILLAMLAFIRQINLRHGRRDPKEPELSMAA